MSPRATELELHRVEYSEARMAADSGPLGVDAEPSGGGSGYTRLASLDEEWAESPGWTSVKGRYSLDWRTVECGACTRYRRPTLVAWALVLCGVAFLGPALIDWRFRAAISSSARLRDSESPSFGTWFSNTGPDGRPVRYNVYYFHVTNPHEVTYEGAKPVVVEKGPYAYNEYYEKFEVDWPTNKHKDNCG